MDAAGGIDVPKLPQSIWIADTSGLALFRRKDQPHEVAGVFRSAATEPSGVGARITGARTHAVGSPGEADLAALCEAIRETEQKRCGDAEAICEAARRSNTWYVAIKSEVQQASALVLRTRHLLGRQQTQLINAIRSHLTEYGWVAPKGFSLKRHARARDWNLTPEVKRGSFLRLCTLSSSAAGGIGRSTCTAFDISEGSARAGKTKSAPLVQLCLGDRYLVLQPLIEGVDDRLSGPMAKLQRVLSPAGRHVCGVNFHRRAAAS